VLAALAALGGAGCLERLGGTEPSPFHAALSLAGTWEWGHAVDEPGLRRVERELWRWLPARERGVVRGHYLREVTVRSSALPFACNQDTLYRQRAWFEVEARAIRPSRQAGGERDPRGAIEIVETSYRVEPSPCDHGFRKLGRYRARVDKGRAELRFPEGRQTLWRTSYDGGALAVPWEETPPRLAGAWQWATATIDEQGLLRREGERWELMMKDAALDAADFGGAAEHALLFDGVYARRVRVESRDGSIIPCAGATAYEFEDRYVLDGKRRGALIAVQETEVQAGEHPCLRGRHERTLDTALLEPRGDFLVLEWRGKRRQVLHRPRAPRPAGEAAALLYNEGATRHE
jgi:hypothetical protein